MRRAPILAYPGQLTNAAFAVAGFGYSKGLQSLYRATGNARLVTYGLRYGVGRVDRGLRVGWKYVARYSYRTSYYVHSAKFGLATSLYQNRGELQSGSAA